MPFQISPKIFENYPGLMIGVLAVKNINNAGSDTEVTSLVKSEEEKVRQLIKSEELSAYPKLQSWLEAHKKFGSKPKDYYPSVYAIVKRVVKGGALPTINKLVDLYNYICLKYIVPVGGEDLDKCVGDIELTYAKGDEEFIEIGGSEQRPPFEGEAVYKDSKGVICRRFNWREADRTKLTESTQNAILVIEALPPVSRGELKTALEEFKGLINKYCGGDGTTAVLGKENQTFDF